MITDIYTTDQDVKQSEADADLGVISIDPILDALDESDENNNDSENSDRSQTDGKSFVKRVALRLLFVGIVYGVAKHWVFN